jgi:hypothetical protein
MRPPPHPRAARIAPVLLAVAVAAGCAGTRSFTIPRPTVAGFPGGRPVPAAVGVFHASDLAGRTAEQEISGPEGETRYVLPIGEAVVETYDDLLPRLFERVQRVPFAGPVPPGAALDGVLEVGLGPVTMSLPPATQTGPCRVTVRQAFTLRDARGETVASWQGAGSGEEPRGALVDCGGRAAAHAIEAAAGTLRHGLSSDPAVRAWLAKLGRKWDPEAAPGGVTRTLARAEEEPEVEPEPRTFGVHGWGGYVWPAASAGHLEEPKGGLALALGGTWRPLRWLGVELVATNLSTSYSSALAIPPPGFTSFSDRLELNQTQLAALARLGWPVWILEPWVGAGGMVGFGLLSWPAAASSGLPDTIRSSAFCGGPVVGAGLDAVVTRNVQLGARWTWLWCKMDLGSLSQGTATVSGNTLLLGGGYWWP